MKTKNKFLLIMVAVLSVMLCTAMSSFAAGSIEFGMKSAATQVNAGETVAVTLSITDNEYGFSKIVGALEFDKGFSVTKKSNQCGNSYEDGDINPQYGNDGTKSPYKVMLTEGESKQAVFTGNAIKFTFAVDESVATGDYTIKFVPETVLGANENDFLAATGDEVTIHVVGKGPSTETKYFAASFVPGVKSAANNAIKFFFEDGTEKGDTTVYYGDVSIENLESVVTAVEVTEVPKDSALKLVDTAWTTIVK